MEFQNLRMYCKKSENFQNDGHHGLRQTRQMQVPSGTAN